MRLFRMVTALFCVLLGALVGALNPHSVRLDLGVVALEAGLGVLVLAALLAGAVCGGLLLALGVIAPLRRELRRFRERDDAQRAPHDMGV